MSYDNWFDKYNLLHLNPNPSYTDSENGPLFTAHLAAILNDSEMAAKAITSIRGSGYYRPSGNNNDPSSHFSHDNMTGLYCLYEIAGRTEKNLPILKWNDRWWMHPRDICFYSYGHWRNPLLLIIPIIAMFISCLRKKEATSGKCLAFVRCKAFKLNKTLKLLTFMLKLKKESWDSIFGIYFKNPEHPINVEMRKLYE